MIPVRKEFNCHQDLRVGEKALLSNTVFIYIKVFSTTIKMLIRTVRSFNQYCIIIKLASLIRIQIIENKCVYYFLLFKK